MNNKINVLFNLTATVLEEPELESAIGVEDREDGFRIRTHEHLKDLCSYNDGDETGHEADEECSEVGTTGRRGKWIRRSLASSGTHHSTELIEVTLPDHPVVTVDSCIQVSLNIIILILQILHYV